MERKKYKCDISIQNFAVPRTSQVLSEMKETLDDHEERITTLENGGELPPQPEEVSERYLYISGGNLIARVVDNGVEAEVASEAFTVTLAAFDGDQEIAGTQQQVSFAEGDELSKVIEESQEGNLYVTSVSPSSYDGVNWTWEEPEPYMEPVEPDPDEPVEPLIEELIFDLSINGNTLLGLFEGQWALDDTIDVTLRLYDTETDEWANIPNTNIVLHTNVEDLMSGVAIQNNPPNGYAYDIYNVDSSEGLFNWDNHEQRLEPETPENPEDPVEPEPQEPLPEPEEE